MKTIKISRNLRNIHYFQNTEFFKSVHNICKDLCLSYSGGNDFQEGLYPLTGKPVTLLHLVAKHIFTPGRYLLKYEHKALASLLVHPVR